MKQKPRLLYKSLGPHSLRRRIRQPLAEVCEAAAAAKGEPAPLSEESSERLSVFEDFLEKLEFDKPDDKDNSEDDDDASASGKPKKPKK